jgi:hypothetical protein
MIFYALCDVKKFKEVVHKIVMKPTMCFTLEEPQQRQKCTSKGEPDFMQTGVLKGKNIANLEYIKIICVESTKILSTLLMPSR